MIKYAGFSLHEIENMLPYEKDIYLSLHIRMEEEQQKKIESIKNKR